MTVVVEPDHYGDQLELAQRTVVAHHYLHKRVDVRSRPFAHAVSGRNDHN